MDAMYTGEARRDVYLILSELLKEPTPEVATELPTMVSILTDALAVLDYAVPIESFSGLTQLAGSSGCLQEAYSLSFVFPLETRVLPVESIYRPWTSDPTTDVPIAREKGHLMSDAALHMQDLYSMHNLAIPEEYHGMPDHLSLELEFAAVLLERGEADRLQVFLDDHLDWVAELAAEARDRNIPLFYRKVLDLADAFIQCELGRG